MENVKTTEIHITEQYGDNCFKDSVQKGAPVDRRPKGKVEIYEQGEDGKQRLVRYLSLTRSSRVKPERKAQGFQIAKLGSCSQLHN